MLTGSLTGALLLVAGPDLLSWAITGVPLQAGALAHPEATLPARVARLAAETPVVPAAPVASTYNSTKAPPVKIMEKECGKRWRLLMNR